MFPRWWFSSFLSWHLKASEQSKFYQDVPNMSGHEINAVLDWIQVRSISAKLPFCWRESYGRGVGEVPGRVADCPSGYKNRGATCGRGTDDYFAPSKSAECPPGYQNMALTCFKGPKPYGKNCFSGTCKPGYTSYGCFCASETSSLGLSYLKCPRGYFKSKLTQRCHQKCKPGYKNIGETCHKPLSILKMKSMTCKAGEKKLGARCYGTEGTLQSCLGEQGENTDGLCYPRCRPGFDGVGPLCWKRCNVGWADCGAGCAQTKSECGLAVADQVIAPLVVAANVVTLGVSAGIGHGIKIGGKLVKASTKVGRAFVFAVDKLQSVKPAGAKEGASLMRRIFVAKTGEAIEEVQTRIVNAVTFQATEKYCAAYAEDFSSQTSPEINRIIDLNFLPKTARYLKQAYGMRQLSEVATSNGWDIADNAISAVSIVDITGISDVVSAYAKPVCRDHRPLPCVRAMLRKCKPRITPIPCSY